MKFEHPTDIQTEVGCLSGNEEKTVAAKHPRAIGYGCCQFLKERFKACTLV